MKNKKILLPALLSIVLVFSLALSGSVAGTSSTPVSMLDDYASTHSAVGSSSLALAMALDVAQGQVTPMVSAGGYHIVGLESDGTVVAMGDNTYGQCNVDGWTDIIQVALGLGHTVGLKSDGTVVTVGDNPYGQRNVGGWTDIIQIAAGWQHTVGLKSDGTMVAAGPEIELAKWNLGVIEYSLTTSSTAGGSVTTPDEGVFTYNAGVMVRVVAKPEAAYRFVNWSGDVDAIARVNDATTIITMHGDYEITANFAINWPLIGGIIAAVAVGLAILFVPRRRAAQTKRKGRKRTARKKRR